MSKADEKFEVVKLYTKDMSFEIPEGENIFKQQWNPELSVDVKVSSDKLTDENLYDVTIDLIIKVRCEEKTAFIVEVSQAGLFNIVNYDDDKLNKMLCLYCPNILFPYAREVVSDLVIRGDFPAIVLGSVNFETILNNQNSI